MSTLLTFSTQFDIDHVLKQAVFLTFKKPKQSTHRDLTVRLSKSEESEHVDEMCHTGMGNWF